MDSRMTAQCELRACAHPDYVLADEKNSFLQCRMEEGTARRRFLSLIGGPIMVTERAPRHRVLKTGSITFGGAAIDCVVRNVSSTGAALEVASPVGAPDEFVLVIAADDVRRQCTVVWRKAKRIGVAFY